MLEGIELGADSVYMIGDGVPVDSAIMLRSSV